MRRSCLTSREKGRDADFFKCEITYKSKRIINHSVVLVINLLVLLGLLSFVRRADCEML